MTGEGSDMKANLKTPILPLLTAAISCALPLAAGATDQAVSRPTIGRPLLVQLHADREQGARRRARASPGRRSRPTARRKTPCVTGPEFGAMGVHFINTDNVDGIVDVNKPEALIYEPQSNGRMRLVGVEFIVPKQAWDALHPASARPAGAARAPAELRRRAEPLRPARVLRDPRLGVRGQPQGRHDRLESAT